MPMKSCHLRDGLQTVLSVKISFFVLHGVLPAFTLET